MVTKMRLSNKSLDEINDVVAKFYAEEYFREERAGHSMHIYEIVDMVYKGLNNKESSLYVEREDIIDEYHQKEYIRMVIYAVLIQIGKITLKHYTKNKDRG